MRQLEQELQSAPSARRGASVADWYPRNPARHVLTGHRQPVTDVAFHPHFSQLASASEDTTIKLYDWETGELEQTLKGHTKPVQSIEFDHSGQYLGTWNALTQGRVPPTSASSSGTPRKAGRTCAPCTGTNTACRAFAFSRATDTWYRRAATRPCESGKRRPGASAHH